ncbi:MAG: hypothetical protein ACYTEL_03900 [Planctomycetota bacterium]
MSAVRRTKELGIRFVHTLLRARDYQQRTQLDDLCNWWREGGM